MPDEVANATAGQPAAEKQSAAPEKPAPDPLAELAALDARYKADLAKRDQSIASVQRELQRARARANDSAQLSEQVAALTAVIAGTPELSEQAKATLAAVAAGTQARSGADAQTAAIGAQIQQLAGSIGVTDWADPRVTAVVEAFEEGDAVEALSLMKAVRRAERAKAAVPEVKPKEADVAKADEARIAAEVERRLRDMGVRDVDKTKSTAGGVKPDTLADLLGKNVGKMTMKERKAHQAALMTAYKVV